MTMPSPSPTSQLLQSPSLANTVCFTAPHKPNPTKFSAINPNLVFSFIPTTSSSASSNPTPPHLSHLPPKKVRLRLRPQHQSHPIDSKKKDISSLENYNGSLSIEEKKHERFDLDGKISRFQVQEIVDRIRGVPFNDQIDSLSIFGRRGGNWSISDFNEVLMALLIANEPDLALRIYSNNYLSSYGLVPDSWTFSIVLRCHCKKNELDEAKRVLNHMLENGFNPDVAVFTSLINSLCKRGKLQGAFEVFEIMGRIGCNPNVQTYNCLLKGLCYVGRVEEAFELMEDIKKSSIEPDIYTYTEMMGGFCKVGRSDEAMELLHEAMEKGLTPNVITFNTLFNGYAKEGRPLEGLVLLKQMKERNCRPDYITYCTLLNGLLLWRKTHDALKIYKEMVGNGFDVHEKLMNRLVRSLCREFSKGNCHLHDVYEVFDKMTNRAFVIDRGTHALVIQALCSAGKVDDALETLQRMIRTECVPRVVTMNRVIRALCLEGKVDKAILVLILMYENRKIPTVISYDLLIRELNRQGRFLAARSVYAAALVRGLALDNKPW